MGRVINVTFVKSAKSNVKVTIGGDLRESSAKALDLMEMSIHGKENLPYSAWDYAKLFFVANNSDI